MQHKPLYRRLGTALLAFGFDPRKSVASIRYLLDFVTDLFSWIRQADAETKGEFSLKLAPILSDRGQSSGVASGHYFHQDLWAARHIHRANPTRHLDIGSRVDGFIAHLLVFREVDVLDIRPLQSKVPGLRFARADLLANTPPDIEQTSSLSCLHALEHFGLGRYGDPISPIGWKIGFKNLAYMLETNGKLLLSVPIGIPTIEFNAQRIFSANQIIHEAKLNSLSLMEFSYIDDEGDFFEAIPHHEISSRTSALTYGCGCFLFLKHSAV